MSKIKNPTEHANETREKLFEAAARVFEDQGIGGGQHRGDRGCGRLHAKARSIPTSPSKDELIIRDARRPCRAIDPPPSSICSPRHDNIDEFPRDALKTMGPQQAGSARPRAPCSHMEMILFRGRAPEKRRARTRTAACARRRKLIADIVETSLKKEGPGKGNPPAWTGRHPARAGRTVFDCTRLIDPETTPADSFSAREFGDFCGARFGIIANKPDAARYFPLAAACPRTARTAARRGLPESRKGRQAGSPRLPIVNAMV